MFNGIKKWRHRFTLLIAMLLMNSAIFSESTYSGHISDDHIHFVDFTQQTDGFTSLINAMNKAKVSNAVVCGLPLIKMWDNNTTEQPIYYLDNDSKLYYFSLTDEIVANAYERLSVEDKKRIHPFLNGFNPNDKNSLAEVQLMIKLHPNVWQGIGEIITRHGVLSNLIEGDTPKANSAALDLIYNFAAQNKLPILLHSDAGTMWVPQDSSFASLPIYLSELTDALKKHPNTLFIWAHAGLDRDMKVNNYPSIVIKLMEKYKNLYIDISGFALPYIVQDDQTEQQWIALINRFPTRVILGTDTLGHFSDYENKISAYNTLLDKLSPAVAANVANNNLMNILSMHHNEVQ